ncbi:MAG TPA: sulfotransferase [Panacibacter sp.]|nr:sulfotransferase [Panacibacter sp.]HNP45502.1 sulfotransferase [Panacibacter sp.]
MTKPVYPNTFIIGVQKAGTTTLDDWLSQHPQIYCYDALKDVHLFGLLDTADIEKKLLMEPTPYKGQPVVLQSAVNYIFYPSLLKAISETQPKAKLIAILRNPVDRAVSAYNYFQKMLREKRPATEALLYEPAGAVGFSKDNNDFTYIEHGLYYRQIKSVLDYFPKEQLLVLSYDELRRSPEAMNKKIFAFLGVEEGFMPDLTPKNITGEVKNQWLQQNLVKQGKIKKFIVKYLINPWMPRSKRKLLKQKMFEMNTSKPAGAIKPKEEASAEITSVVAQLPAYFKEDTRQLDALLGTGYYGKWFAE